METTPNTAYNCYVRPAGQLTHEVPKTNCSAQELVLLRFIHGADAVVRITKAGEFKEFDKDTELRRLAQIYDPRVVGRVFNVLPEFLVEDDYDDEGNREFISMEVVESEAMGEQVELGKVVKDAGRHAAAPQAVDTGPAYLNEDAKAVAAESSRSME